VSLLASTGGGCGGGSTNKPKAMRSQRGHKVVVPTAFEKKQSASSSNHALKNPFEILFERRVKMTQ
jgi:hypothetical protein